VFLMLLVFTRIAVGLTSDSSLVNRTTKGSDGANSGNQKVCLGLLC